MRAVYEVLNMKEPEEGDSDDAKTDYKTKKKLLLWHLDKYLPAACGELSYGKARRYYQLAVESFELRPGKKAVLVESASEAFGLVIHENCYEKWCHIAPKKHESPHWKVPQYTKNVESTHPFHTAKFSDPHGGQGNGWIPAARMAQETNMKNVRDFRTADKKDDYAKYKTCKEWLRQEHGITEDSPVSKQKKRKRNNTKATVNADDFIDLDDSGDSVNDFSVGSELPNDILDEADPPADDEWAL